LKREHQHQYVRHRQGKLLKIDQNEKG